MFTFLQLDKHDNPGFVKIGTFDSLSDCSD